MPRVEEEAELKSAKCDHLFRLLGHERTIDAALRQPAGTLNARQKKGLRKLNDHYNAVRTGNGNQQVARNRRAARPRSPFSRFLRLSEVDVMPEIAAYISERGTDPRLFFDREGMRHGLTAWTKDQVGDAFIECYEYTVKLTADMKTDHIRWLFHMLLFYDILQLVIPGSTGRYMTKSCLQSIKDFLGPLIHDNSPIDVDIAAKELQEWCMWGTKIQIMCDAFNVGCLFVFPHLLSQDFLRTKVTESGPYYDEAVSHLRDDLHLDAVLEESGAEELGRMIRQHLFRPFQEAAEYQRGTQSRST